MNIVRISAGLGNQLFQYAFYRAMKAIHPDTKMDISEFKYRKHHYGYELEKIFTIIPDYATQKEVHSMADVSKQWLSKFRRETLGIKLKSKGQLIDETQIGAHFHPELTSLTNAYFQGFWQSPNYFANLEASLRQELSFKGTLSPKNREIANEIASSNSVSIHIRRGDYLKKRRFENVGSVCGLTYYNRCMEHIANNIQHPTYFIFSDDMDWVKTNLQVENARYIDFNTGEDSFRDMQLMSLCKHNIIANSSFSWWGAWLNAHPDKKVLAPSLWFRDQEMTDIIPATWIRIQVD